MTFIVLELFPEPYILTNMDGEIWKTDLETAKELAEECQQGMVVPLNTNLITEIQGLLREPTELYIHNIFEKYDFNEQDTTT